MSSLVLSYADLPDAESENITLSLCLESKAYETVSVVLCANTKDMLLLEDAIQPVELLEAPLQHRGCSRWTAKVMRREFLKIFHSVRAPTPFSSAEPRKNTRTAFLAGGLSDEVAAKLHECLLQLQQVLLLPSAERSQSLERVLSEYT